MHASAAYNLAFAAAVCVVCAIVVSTAAVALQDLQAANAALEKRRNVLVAAGLAASDERPSPEEIDARFQAITAVVIDVASGEEVADIDPAVFDDRAAAADQDTSRAAADNPAGIARVAHHTVVYELHDAGELGQLPQDLAETPAETFSRGKAAPETLRRHERPVNEEIIINPVFSQSGIVS